VTTELATTAVGPVAAERELLALAVAVAELESRPMSLFRTLAAPAAEIEQRAAELGAAEVVQRARLLRIGVQLREGHSEQGGRSAHQVLSWAQENGSPYLHARAHRELAIFYRQVGDVASALTHAVQCVANLTDDVSPTIRARHLLSLAVALDESGSNEEADRRFQEALVIATAIEDHELTLYILNNLAYTAYESDDEPTARDLIARMRAVQSRSRRMFSANELDTIARVELMSGRYAAVESTLSAALDGDHSTVLGNEGDAIAECWLTLAESRRLDRRFEAAQHALDAARRMCDARGLSAVRARAREEQAALHAATGRFQEAYEEHRAFYAETSALHSSQRDARARALQAVFEATEARRSVEHFREMAYRDALTGLYNRRYIDERLPALLHETAVQRTPMSIALIDLDHFKRINDTLSHDAGDAVLRRVAEILNESATGQAIAARMGGEEFLLVMPGADAETARERCEEVRQFIRSYPWQPITGSMPVTTSIGVTTSPDGSGPLAALLAQADRHLYAAKHAGRDRVR
jgi:diguanylate cyclase (GGDEF)-like protein